MADVVGPGLDAGSRADVLPAGQRLVRGVGHRCPGTVQPVGQVGLVIAPAVLFDDRQILAGALEPVGVAGLEYLGLQGKLAVAETLWKIGQVGPEPPHLSVQAGEEQVGTTVVADDPIVEAANFAGIAGTSVEHRPSLGPGAWIVDGSGRREGHPHVFRTGHAHLVDQVPLILRREIEHLRGAIVVAIAHGEDRAIRAVGLIPIGERAILDCRSAGQLDGHEDMPLAAVEDKRGILLGPALIAISLRRRDKRGAVLPHGGNLEGGRFRWLFGPQCRRSARWRFNTDQHEGSDENRPLDSRLHWVAPPWVETAGAGRLTIAGRSVPGKAPIPLVRDIRRRDAERKSPKRLTTGLLPFITL